MHLIRAAVHRTIGEPLTIEEVELDGPRPDELLVRLVSVGICRSDVHALMEVPGPAVLGHEGAGIVEEVGTGVAGFSLGDQVLMTFASCGSCRRCHLGEPAYCERFLELNFAGYRPDGSSALSIGGEPIAAHFLGQSCFATHCVVQERSAVRLRPELDLGPLGPFGCGFQTGAGAVMNALRPMAGDSLAVFGSGAVGLAAIGAAAIVGCDPVIAVDVAPDRLERARRFGATETIDAGADDPKRALAELATSGLDFALDTTGVATVVRTAVEALNTRGVCGVIGAGASSELVIDWRTLLNGRTVTGIIAGNSVPQVFLPELVALFASGRLPLDELVTYFAFEDINEALAASESGAAVKPVLTFTS